MRKSRGEWDSYITELSKLNTEAAEKMKQYLDLFGIPETSGGRQMLLNYAYSLTSSYGEAAANLACRMYDESAAWEGVRRPAAEPAPVATFDEVAKAVNGTIKRSKNTGYIGSTVGRLVKQAGADTTLKNAKRDGAEFAWIPHGDTCAFCITLASRGWQRMSKKAMQGDHAEHIHANCDCEYAVRFNGRTEIEGYDPEKYLEMYENAEGKTSQDKINAMRRDSYAAKKIDVVAQKKAAEEAKSAGSRGVGADVTEEYWQNATPGIGTQTKEDGFRDVNGEEAMGGWLMETFGGDITLLAEHNPDGEPNPDYFWNGKLWDLKTTSTEKAANSAIRSAIKQIGSNAGGIILDYREQSINHDLLMEVIKKRMQWHRGMSVDIIIIESENIFVYRYN